MALLDQVVITTLIRGMSAKFQHTYHRPTADEIIESLMMSLGPLVHLYAF